MKNVFKLLGAVIVLWVATLALVMGALTTGLVVTGVLFVVGLLALFGGAWLTVYLLRRDTGFTLHFPLIWLIPVGAVVAAVLASLLRHKI